MNNRKFNTGDRIICSESGVIGIALRFYTPTSCSEQTVVRTGDGREYHALTSTWKLSFEGNKPTSTMIDEIAFVNCQTPLVPFPYSDLDLKFIELQAKAFAKMMSMSSSPQRVFNTNKKED